MDPKPRSFSCTEAAAAHVKIDGLLRLVATITAFLFWYAVAIVLVLLGAFGFLPYSSLLSPFQALSAVGLAPIAVALASRRAFEWAFSKYLTGYAKKYFQYGGS